jgi:hypothetical protein
MDKMESTLRKSSTDSTETSAKTTISQKFKKLKPVCNRDYDNEKFQEDINYIFSEDPSKFIGEFVTQDYRMIRGYMNGAAEKLRLYYTKLEPLHGTVASLCIIHGIGQHSGRFLDVRILKRC